MSFTVIFGRGGEPKCGGKKRSAVWVQENPDYVPEPVPDSEKDSAQMFMDVVDEYKSVDKLIASAELRRDRTLREIEHRREHLARRLRKASDEIIEDKIAELPKAA